MLKVARHFDKVADDILHDSILYTGSPYGYTDIMVPSSFPQCALTDSSVSSETRDPQSLHLSVHGPASSFLTSSLRLIKFKFYLASDCLTSLSEGTQSKNHLVQDCLRKIVLQKPRRMTIVALVRKIRFLCRDERQRGAAFTRQSNGPNIVRSSKVSFLECH